MSGFVSKNIIFILALLAVYYQSCFYPNYGQNNAKCGQALSNGPWHGSCTDTWQRNLSMSKNMEYFVWENTHLKMNLLLDYLILHLIKTELQQNESLQNMSNNVSLNDDGQVLH